MLGRKNTNKKNVMSGVGIALLLCALMVGMTMTNLVQTEAPQAESEFTSVNDDSEDIFALPETYEPAKFEYDESSELEGLRTENQKSFRQDDGQITMVTTQEPIHYLDDIGSWQPIDLNIEANAYGWSVTENSYEVSFNPDTNLGVSMSVDPNVDPIVTGINPAIVMLDSTGISPVMYKHEHSEDSISVGGNVIRYPVGNGFDLDYTVSANQMKQNLIIREQPDINLLVGSYFGFSEQMILPEGFGLFLGDDLLGEDITKTKEELTIRNLETGETLVSIPQPFVEDQSEETSIPYIGTYFIQVFEEVVVITTTVESDWLMDEDRYFPVVIDPTLSVSRYQAGYCYVYYPGCYSSTSSYHERTRSTVDYVPYIRLRYTAGSIAPTDIVNKIEYRQYYDVSRGTPGTVQIKVLENCGYSSWYARNIYYRSCSNTLLTSTSSTARISASYNSATAATVYVSGSDGWRTSTLCGTTSACASTSGSHNYVKSTAINGGYIQMSEEMTSSGSSTKWYRTYNSYTRLIITYTLGADNAAPDMDFVPYDGITSYKSGERTFFANLKDFGGIDGGTNAPHLHYRINNSTSGYTPVAATAIGTCGTSTVAGKDCNYRATTAKIETGQYVDYFWAYRDASSNSNFATTPSGGSGTPSVPTAPSNTYSFFVDDVANAGDDKKLVITTTDVRAYSSRSSAVNFDRQMTYYEGSNEYVYEFDTSNCGTGTSSCFSTGSSRYNEWSLEWMDKSGSNTGYNNYRGYLRYTTGTSASEGVIDFTKYLATTADNGPGMNLIVSYDTNSNDWALVGLGTQTSIEEVNVGTTPTRAGTYGASTSYRFQVPGDITGQFGKISWNKTYSSINSNWVCVGTDGMMLFFRSTSTNPDCRTANTYSASTSYHGNFISMGTSYYAPQASSGSISYSVMKIAPEEDTYPPVIEHLEMGDSHSKKRKFTFNIVDKGSPPTGLDTTVANGPMFWYQITAANGTVSAWDSKILSPSDTRLACGTAPCDWSTTLEDLERNSSVDYYVNTRDTSIASTGINTNNTSSLGWDFTVGDPNKVVVIEWHDVGYNQNYLCTYQVRMYDVTNEIEFHYDTGCQAYYDRSTVGFMDQNRSIGATLRGEVNGGNSLSGANPHTSNYRITTGPNGEYSYETFDLGMSELSPGYKTLISGQVVASGSWPAPSTPIYGSYCATNRTSYDQYLPLCFANVDLDDDFVFNYFGTEYDGNDSKNRMQISRFGSLYLTDDGNTTRLERAMRASSATPDFPVSNDNYIQPGTIAPWYGYYSSYRCYDTTTIDCSVRMRTIPFDGKGTDVTSDITEPTTWTMVDSPVRIDPTSASGYLRVNNDLTIEPGVVIQVAAGKGISFDSTCDKFTATGTSTERIVIEGQQGAAWKGLAFTAACPTGTDDRHTMTYVDFNNTTHAAIAAGSRHGDSPVSNDNVGNFTMSNVIFTNVDKAFEHGSGEGTIVTMNNFTVNKAHNSCLDFASQSIVTLRNGELNDCNFNGTSTGYAITNVMGGNNTGSLIIENVNFSNSNYNLISVDFESLWISNVTATTATAQLGTSLSHLVQTNPDTELYVYNFNAPGYASARMTTLKSYSLEDVDLGTATVLISPASLSSNAVGASGDSASIDNLESGNLTLGQTAPQLNNIDVGKLEINGDSPSSDPVMGANWVTEDIVVSGCGYSVVGENITTGRVYGTCYDIAKSNTITLTNADVTYTGTTRAIYARNSVVVLGNTTVDMPVSFVEMSKASTSGRIVLIDTKEDGTTCDSITTCNVSASGSGAVYFGSLATVKVYKDLGGGAKEYKEGHTVQAKLVDSGSALFTIGSHKTDINGQAKVWVISSDANGDNYTDHNLVAYGASGQNETTVIDPWYPGSFGVGDTIELRLEPAPVTLDGTNMDCDYLRNNNSDAALGYDGTIASGGTNTFTWEGKVTMFGDLTIDDCNIVVKDVFRVASDSILKPKLTIASGGKLVISKTTTSTGFLKASTSTFPLDLDFAGGVLEVTGGRISDVDGGINLDSGSMTVSANSIIYGSSLAAATEATLLVNGGTLDWDDSTIQNSGQKGIGLMFDGSEASVDNIIVKNAAVGIYSHNSAPTVNGFTLNDNDVGVDVEGGMSLPKIYRSPLLSGKSTGWHTYAIDLSAFMDGSDYMQVGLDSVYEGGNAHPTYTSRGWYFITDRMAIGLTDGANTWNISGTSSSGYYDGSNGGSTRSVGVPFWSCSWYGYTQNQGYPYAGEYRRPTGFDWVATENSPTNNRYPQHYWGTYNTARSNGFTGLFTPPDGGSSSYNACPHYASNAPVGSGGMMTFPIVDISGSNISGATVYIDVLHNKADNYQDRIELAVSTGDDPSNMGAFTKNLGSTTFESGSITGAKTGIELGDNGAGLELNNVTVTNPVTSGLDIVGSSAASLSNLNVTGGTYGVLVNSGASGTVNLNDVHITGTTKAGVYYIKNLDGALGGIISNNTGAGIMLGKDTNTDLSWTGLPLSSNGVGIEALGSGTITFTNSSFTNTKDVVIDGSSAVKFIEGDIDKSTVEVTGSGLFSRIRHLDINIVAEGLPVANATVVLNDGQGSPAGNSMSDANGNAIDIEFTTTIIDSTGLTNMSLSGYEAVTVAQVGEYFYTSPTNNSADFRYAFDPVTLTDSSSNLHTINLVTKVDYRVCYSYSSSYHNVLSRCAGATTTAGTVNFTSGLKEFGYSGATPSDMSGKVIMVDSGYWYLDGDTSHSLNNSRVIVTGSYNSLEAVQVRANAPYGARLHAHNSEWISIAQGDSGGPESQGIYIGYNGRNNIIPDIQNSTMINLASITSKYGAKYSWAPQYIWDVDFFNVKNNTITHFYTSENTGGSQYYDMCVNIGSQNVVIEDNVFNNCGDGVFVTRTSYSYYHASSYWGADGAIIHNNTFKDTSHLDIWFYLNSYSDGVQITNNTFTGTSSPSYGVYTQDRTTNDLLIKGNTFTNSDEPIYMRGSQDWNITENTIYGKGDASFAGIFVRNGYGVIDGNTLIDTDGGILVDGITTGFNAEITNNNITQSSGRVAPAAIGIWAENCGRDVVNTGGNTISIMENAIVTDGCDLVDTGSKLNALGGAGGTVYSVSVDSNVFTPSYLNISEGDSVRWRAAAYYGGTVPHDVTSNTTNLVGGSWTSGQMNLGSTYTKTFTIPGTYDYHCSVHPFMYGTITVSAGNSGTFSSVGVNVVGTTDDITLDGTEVSGFETAIEQFGGDLTLSGGAILSGATYAAYVEDTDVTVDGAELIAGNTGSAMFIRGASSFDATDMSTSGLVGLDINAIDFRWNGGDSDATTTLLVDGAAKGSVENMTWANTGTQINAGQYVTVTSVGNSLDASKLIVDSTAVIHEGNLLDLNITHKGGSASDVGLMIHSTDGAQAAYVSPAYRTSIISTDGDLADWYGNVKNPSDDAMPGVMSSNNAGEDFLATWDATNLYLALTGVDMGSADLQIYIDSNTGGDTTSDNWYVNHNLPFAADYLFWAEDGADGNSGLKVKGLTGWTDVTTSCGALTSTIGYTADTDTEVKIPWTCIGAPASNARIIVIVQDESTGAMESVHPSQTFAPGAVGQTFNESLTLLMGHDDLVNGDDLTNHLLIYRSYVGSNTPSDAKTYDISVKVNADCEEDWGNLYSIDMSTNVAKSIDILRACPVIQNLVDITVNEDSGAYTLTLLDKADDEQDAENTLTWTVADDSDPTRSPSMLLDSGLSVQTMTITPDNDQFGDYVFHFEVEDSHGLKDNVIITFSVLNVNDAPIICNSERVDCMPVFADDGDGNLNVLDEGFGSVSKVLGSAANTTGYIIDMASNDMANEQPQEYTWGAKIKGEDVTVDPYWVQKKYNSVAEMFAEVGSAVTSQGGFQDIAMTGDPSSISPNGTYTLPTLNDVSLLTYLLAQNGCGSVWYQEYMDSSGNKVTAVRSDDGCDSTIDANAKVYNSLNYTDFWMEAYGVDVDSFSTTWASTYADGYTTSAGYNPCPAFSVLVVNNELTIVENAANELGGECTIVLSLTDDGGYCDNTYLGRTTDAKASCVSYTWLIDYDVIHPVYGPMTVTGCYNLYLGLASFIPEYLAPGVPSGMTSDICLAYSWIGENTDAVDYEVNFSVTPVNDAPEVLDWDRQAGVVISDGNGEVPSFPWKVTLTEDDENIDNLTYDLAAMKHDNDHVDADLKWTIAKSDTCDYENYFAAEINGDEISFDLIKDATTNAPEWEVDYLSDAGIHQKNPLSGEFCPITLYLRDTADAPSYVPNYDMTTANYQQGEDSVTIYVRVDNVAENVPDYFLNEVSGFDFNELSNVMPKTFVPTTVTIGHGGDTGPYNYDHMLEVTFHSNGYNSDDENAEGYVNLGTQYVTPPAYGETIEVTDFVYITSTSKIVWVEVDVLTCVAEVCDMSESPEDRYFGYSFPYAHRSISSNGEQGSAWSSPGEVGSSSVDANGNPSAVTLNNKRRPMLEDQDWCNNLMSTEDNGSDCGQPRTFGKKTIGSGQELPTVVRLIGTADVPSFAPSIIAISAAGLFVSALVLQSRRDDEEESLEEMILEADEQAVSPVIATILMVAITVVLSGVIYVWASSLADTSAKGVPRMTFDVDSDSGEFHRIVVTASQVELATQAMEVTIEYTDSTGQSVSGSYNLADTTVYGFYPGNSDSMVTFGDAVGGENGAVKSSFDTGDTIYVKSVDENGDPIRDIYVSISYVPSTGAGSVLRTWDSL